MEWLNSVFGVFSQRKLDTKAELTPVTPEFRNRVLMLCRDVLGPTGYITEFWEQIHQRLQYLHGTAVLAPDSRVSSRTDDAVQFLAACESEHFLDFVEYIFQVDAFWRVPEKQAFVDQINRFLDVEELPYHLTEYVEVEETGSFRGAPTTYIKVGSYPRVILKEHRLIHAEAGRASSPST